MKKMNKALRLTIIAFLTFASASLMTVSTMALFEALTGTIETNVFAMAILLGMSTFCVYALGEVLYRIVTGTEFN